MAPNLTLKQKRNVLRTKKGKENEQWVVPLIVFFLWVILMTILMTWVYNHTQSVLLAIIMHSAANGAFNYLPLLPEFTGQLEPFLLLLGLLGLVVTAVVFGDSKHIGFFPGIRTRTLVGEHDA